jgi:hypothetical protein
MEPGQIFLYSTYFGSAFSSMRQQQKFDSIPFRSVRFGAARACLQALFLPVSLYGCKTWSVTA